MPLVFVDTGRRHAVDPRRELARRLRPEYARGELVRVAGGRNQAEAEMIQLLLLDEGVPSILRRSAGFDVPDFLAAGPRDVLVPESGAGAARELLVDAGLAHPDSPGPRAHPRADRLLAAIAGGGLAAALVAWALLRAAST
jgi:hypothetical protein